MFAAPAVTSLIEDRTGWSIKKFVRTVQIRASAHLLTAEDPLPDDLRDALALINGSSSAHYYESSGEVRQQPVGQ